MFSYEQMQQFGELDMMIYNYVITHAKQVAGMTIRQLAGELNVSSTSILRFCSKLGCEGYSEFKFRLREYMKNQGNQELSNDFTVIEEFFKKVKEGNLNEEIRRAAEIISSKGRVFFMGMGTSGTMGKYGARYLSNFGKYAMYIEDPFYPTDNNIYEDTAVVVLSVSGEQEYLFREVQGLKKGHATIISITNSRQCTLAEMSDFNLNYYIPMKVLPGRYNVTSSIPVVYILETLAHDVAEIQRRKDTAAE